MIIAQWGHFFPPSTIFSKIRLLLPLFPRRAFFAWQALLERAVMLCSCNLQKCLTCFSVSHNSACDDFSNFKSNCKDFAGLKNDCDDFASHKSDHNDPTSCKCACNDSARWVKQSQWYCISWQHDDSANCKSNCHDPKSCKCTCDDSVRCKKHVWWSNE